MFMVNDLLQLGKNNVKYYLNIHLNLPVLIKR